MTAIRTYPTTAIGTLVGVVDILKIAAPGAGNDWTVNLPGGYYYRLIGGGAVFTTSAVVANRNVGLRVTSSDGMVYGISQGASSVASTVYQVAITTVTPQGAIPGINGAWQLGAPGFWLQAGWTLSSRTNNIDVGDAYTSIALLVEKLAIGEYGGDRRAHMDYEPH